jgi:hypothetical protein
LLLGSGNDRSPDDTMRFHVRGLVQIIVAGKNWLLAWKASLLAGGLQRTSGLIVLRVGRSTRWSLLVVLKPNRIIRKSMNANCSIFHLRVFLGLSNPQGQRQTSTISIPCDNFGERKGKFNLETSRTTQM